MYEWKREKKTTSAPYPLVEYSCKQSSCVIRLAFRTYDGGRSYLEDGWDVVCIYKNGNISHQKVAWFRSFKDAQRWIESRPAVAISTSWSESGR